MKTSLIRLPSLWTFLLAAALLQFTVLGASQESGVDKTLKTMLGAIQTGSVEEFAKEGDDNFKNDATQTVLDQAKAVHGGRLEKGYQATYLTVLKQQGKKVHCWKITFKDNGDDLLIRITFSHGKVAGFLVS